MESLPINPIVLSDSYKVSHWKQYPKNTEYVYSYFESRGGEFPYTIFFGLQYFLKNYLKAIVITERDILEAKDLFLEKHWGCLPISIKAVPEGTKVPVSNVLMTVENTDPKCYWLTNYLETLLVQVWYPTTVATQSYAIKQNILRYLRETGDEAGIMFKLHDFGFRGVSSVESAAIGGAAHLVNFMGTDTMAAFKMLRDFYKCPMAGFSIPAAEHSTICSWGRENENKAMENMLDQYPEGLVACVSDSFNIFKACEDIWGTQLKDKVMNRNGTLVIRPDSGDPASTVLEVMRILDKKFGSTVNAKGFKVLDPHVRVIQGDGVNHDSINAILENLKNNGFSADNLAFGMGGALLQKLNRDTQNFAFKCSSVTIDGKDRDVSKTPITDTGKFSKSGKLKLIRYEGSHGSVLQTVTQDRPGKDLLVEVFRDGEILKEYTLDEVRANASN
jgi:nicotinamide phosphoribosyltransferase